jgi:hypothetical protein
LLEATRSTYFKCFSHFNIINDYICCYPFFDHHTTKKKNKNKNKRLLEEIKKNILQWE